MSIDDPEILYVGKFVSVVKEGNWEYLTRNTETGGIVSILPITENNEVVLVEQFRIPVNSNVIECPAGVIGDDDTNETPLECAKKELLEETGYTSDNWICIYASPKSPGLITEIDHKFIARDCKKVAGGGGVETEDITVHVISLDHIDDWLRLKSKTKLVSGGIYGGLYFL
jgi:ADP-ribose pyrophosphatase